MEKSVNGDRDVSWFGEKSISNLSAKHNSTKAIKTTANVSKRSEAGLGTTNDSQDRPYETAKAVFRVAPKTVKAKADSKK